MVIVPSYRKKAIYGVLRKKGENIVIGGINTEWNKRRACWYALPDYIHKGLNVTQSNLFQQ